MPLSREDTQRALSILESILTQLEGNDPLETDEDDEDNFDDIVRLQHVVDVMRSPLFSTLVDVRNNYEQTIDPSLQSDETANSPSSIIPTSHEGKLESELELELQAQFRLSYEVPPSVLQNGQVSNASEEESITTLSPSQRSSSVSIGASEFEFHSTFVSTKSRDQSHDSTLNESPSANGRSNYKSNVKNRKDSTGSASSERSLSRLAKRFSIGRKKSTGSNSSVSLADLARFPPRGERSDSEMKSMVGSAVKSEDRIPRFVRRLTTSSESSLSSMSSESVPLVKTKPLKDSSILEQQPPNDGSLVFANSDVCEEVDGEAVMSDTSQQSRDILFFMRDKQCQTKIQEILQNREPREVNIVMREGWTGEGRGSEGLGVDLVGLSSTGVFVANVHAGSCDTEAAKVLQQGDQIMEINSTKIENMASFEVDLLLSDITVGSDVHLVVKYNPSGLADYQRLTRK